MREPFRATARRERYLLPANLDWLLSGYTVYWVVDAV
jgi:hypothetical protein